VSRRTPPGLEIWGPAVTVPALFLVTYRWTPAWLFPALLAAPLAPPFVRLVRRGLRGRAFAAALLWAAGLAISATSASMQRPVEAERTIWRARAYAEQTVSWVRTGQGEEADPRRFVPRHLLELAAFAALSLLTAGAGGLVLGAALLNYMSFYVAALWRLSGAPAALILGWPPWALVRVVAYIAIGTALAGPLAARGLPQEERPPFARWLLACGLAGVGLDLFLKSTLPPLWRNLLLRTLGGPP
jgi:hypothetical protein